MAFRWFNTRKFYLIHIKCVYCSILMYTIKLTPFILQQYMFYLYCVFWLFAYHLLGYMLTCMSP